MDCAIAMQDIHKDFGAKTAIKNVSIEINRGELFGFLGPSGAGKTTTIKIVTGQLRQTGGTATILGRDTLTLNHEIYSQIGIVTDNSGVYENMTAYDNLLLFSRILNTDKSEIPVLLKKVGLGDDSKKRVKKFSKGMKQRLILARAMLNRPKILFLDEPTSGLDPSTAIEIHNLMMEMKAEGTTFFLTTHNMAEASKLCDRIALFNEGIIVDMGTLDELSQKYNTEKSVKIVLEDGEEQVLPINAESSGKIAELVSSGKVLTIHSQEPTLEDIFLKLTGRGLS
ncbi:MAG: ABC transporter ATP-binding protein [Defluviitaleaceae bacterium]|nr:ABC transporter ATP-binding protein [Defluviitaleaceae bacterium]MCL2218077.1 ABC transporter ATP-binding protein [Defluviitaleaceae bacterium]